MPRGYFTFVLHSHLPYVRNAGRWPHGEEMIHEALAETYVPLLNALFDLIQEGLKPRLTLGLTPILLEQLADPEVNRHFELYLAEEIEVAKRDAKRFVREGLDRQAALARYYASWYSGIQDTYERRFDRDVVGAFRRLRVEGVLDIITSAATHGYLPLLERDSSIDAQLEVGTQTTRRHLGHHPRGIWLPECGYRPAFYGQGNGDYVPGIEEFLANRGIDYFFTDTSVIEGSALVGKIANDVHGPYGGLPDRDLAAPSTVVDRDEERTALRPYYVRSSRVAAFGRDARTGTQVWSAKQGYPGDFLYREFHRKDPESGLQYWRVSGAEIDLQDKDLYDPDRALAQVQIHADHFVRLLADIVCNHHSPDRTPGLIVSAYDTELFGHWWFEGVEWIKQVLRRLAKQETIGMTTAAEYLDRFPPTSALNLPESSWGSGGNHWTWLNPNTEWVWPLVHAAESEMELLVARFPDEVGWRKCVLNQAARELLLLESSDWPFLISTGQAREYAFSRFQGHLSRFNRLALIAGAPRLHDEDEQFVKRIEELDNPFPWIDYRAFKARKRANSRPKCNWRARTPEEA